MNNRGHGGSVMRNEYLIDRFPVVFEWGGGWRCACPDFLATNECRHTREAAGRRAAQAQIAKHVGNRRSDLRPRRGRDDHPGKPRALDSGD